MAAVPKVTHFHTVTVLEHEELSWKMNEVMPHTHQCNKYKYSFMGTGLVV